MAHQHDHADPHAHPGTGNEAHGGHHHYIIPWQKNVLVLAILLFFTFLTVALAQGEKWAQASFDIGVIPTWVNVTIVMSIAAIKGTLVAMYFMQLRYSNPLNTFAMLFCLFGVALFLGFTMLDLGNRDRVYSWRSGEIVPGGSLPTRVETTVNDDGTVQRNHISLADPMYIVARDEALNRQADDKAAHRAANGLYAFDKDVEAFNKYAEKKKKSHGTYHEDQTASTPDRTRPRHGPTPGIFDDEPAGTDAAKKDSDKDHGSDH